MAYSEEDHLLTAGTTTYQYDADGFLVTKTKGTEVVQYSYSSRGELLQVVFPDNKTIDYIHNPLGRRIAKLVNGVITEKYLWQGPTRLLAVYDGVNNLLMRFEYADARMPVAMSRTGTTYYLTYDQVGSLRIVADSSGNVVKQIGYDSFGNIINDTNSSFTIPFGFAGGLHDRDTGLVRFGYRDYDPDIGRWTAKDQMMAWVEDTDIYGYCLNDPIGWIDPLGLQTWPGSGQVTSPFGWRTDPYTGERAFHNAADIANPVGDPVVASDSGTVISTTPSPNGANQVIIRNDDGSVSGYAHVNPSVQVGDHVNEGDSIGTTDRSGRSTGGHVHYTYRPAEGQPHENPLDHLPDQNNYPNQGENPCR